MVVIGAAIQLFAVSATVYVQKAAPEAQRGHALSAYNAGFMGFVSAGSFVVAGLAVLAGTRWALIVPGAVIMACGVIMLASTSSRPLSPRHLEAFSADFRTAISALGLSGEFEVELASAPPGDGGVGGEAGVAEDG